MTGGNGPESRCRYASVRGVVNVMDAPHKGALLSYYVKREHPLLLSALLRGLAQAKPRCFITFTSTLTVMERA